MSEHDIIEQAQGKRRRPPAWLAVAGLIDAALRAYAVRTALRKRQYLWVVALSVVSSGGVLPLVYLVRFRRPEPEAPAQATA